MEQQNKENLQNIVENVVPVVQQPKQNNTLVIILSILLLISMSVSGYFAYQTQTLVKELKYLKTTQQPTPLPSTPQTEKIISTGFEDWKTYTDLDFGFSIKYPSDFEFIEKSKSASYVVIKKLGGEVEGTDSFSHFRITIEKDSSKSIEESINNAKENSTNIFGNDINFTPTENVSLNNIQGRLYYHSGYGYQQHIFTINKANNNVLHITVIFANEDVQKQEQSQVNQILSTFKFTN